MKAKRIVLYRSPIGLMGYAPAYTHSEVEIVTKGALYSTIRLPGTKTKGVKVRNQYLIR